MTPSQAKGICGVRNQDHGYPLVGGVATRRRYKGGLLGALNVLFLSLSLWVLITRICLLEEFMELYTSGFVHFSVGMLHLNENIT